MENIVKVRACFTGCNINSDQTVMFVDTGSGEVIDGQEEAFADDDEDEDGSYQLPPAAYEYEDIQDEAA